MAKDKKKKINQIYFKTQKYYSKTAKTTAKTTTTAK